MRSLKRVLLVVAVLLLVLAILAFVLENQQSVSLLFLGFTLPQLPVSVLLVVALLLGLFLGPALGMLVVWRGRRKRRLKLRDAK